MALECGFFWATWLGSEQLEGTDSVLRCHAPSGLSDHWGRGYAWLWCGGRLGKCDIGNGFDEEIKLPGRGIGLC